MPSISPDPSRALALALALLAFGWAAPSRAADKSGQLCEVTSAVSGEGQLRDRTKRCKKDDVLIVPLTTAAIAATRVAAFVCDFSARVLIEETTEAPGVARVTCSYAGEFRSKR